MARIKFIEETTANANGNFGTTDLPDTIGKVSYIVIQMAWGIITGTKDMTVQPEVSLDGTNFDIIGTAVTLAANSDSTTFSILNQGYTKIRIAFKIATSTSVDTLDGYISGHTHATAV